MMRKVAALFAIAAVACGPNDEDFAMSYAEACAMIEGCENPANAIGGPTIAVWRVTVVQETDGTYHIRDVEEIDVAASLGPPPGPIDGQRALVALDENGDPVEVQLLKFTNVETYCPFEPLSGQIVEEVDGPLRVTGFLTVSAATKTIAVMQEDGTIDDFLDPPRNARSLTGPQTRMAPLDTPITACSHVRLDLYGTLESEGHGVPMSNVHAALINSALGMMTPAHCAGVRDVALVDDFSDAHSGGWTGSQNGSIVHINRALEADNVKFSAQSIAQSRHSQAAFQAAVLHEAAHATHFLLQHVNNPEDGMFQGDWAVNEKSRALDASKEARLPGGLSAAWGQMQRSYYAAGWSGEYTSDRQLSDQERQALKQAAPDAVGRRGYISVYGANILYDDIAETVTQPIAGRLYERAGVSYGPTPDRSDYGCKVLNESAGLPEDLAAIYTKLQLVRDLELITEEQFQRCVGNVGLPAQASPVAVFVDGQQRASMATAEASLQETTDGSFQFELEASGNVPTDSGAQFATMRLIANVGRPVNSLDELSWVRGGFLVRTGGAHKFSVELRDASHMTYTATDAVILITQATNKSIRGSVIVKYAMRYGAPFPVPQTGLPEVWRFHLRK